MLFQIELLIGFILVFLIKIIKPLGRMVKGLPVQGVLLFYGIAVHNIEPIVIPCAQYICMKAGLQGTKSVPQGKLVQAVSFKVLHIFAAEQAAALQGRSLCQGAAFRLGNLFWGRKPGEGR